MTAADLGNMLMAATLVLQGVSVIQARKRKPRAKRKGRHRKR